MTLHTIQTVGAKLIVEETGAGDLALIFLHYWGGSARTWRPVIACLPASTRNIVLNQRGWGGSVATDGRYDLDALADDVLAVTEALGVRRFILVGHSMGGKIAQIVAGRRPDGLEGLVLVAPAPPTPMEVPEDPRRNARVLPVAGGYLAGARRAVRLLPSGYSAGAGHRRYAARRGGSQAGMA